MAVINYSLEGTWKNAGFDDNDPKKQYLFKILFYESNFILDYNSYDYGIGTFHGTYKSNKKQICFELESKQKIEEKYYRWLQRYYMLEKGLFIEPTAANGDNYITGGKWIRQEDICDLLYKYDRYSVQPKRVFNYCFEKA
jgi:hypothetical protein